MAYGIRFEMHYDILCFEIAGNIACHLDSIAKYVMGSIARYRIENVLVDLRGAVGRPGPARLFIHVLRYPFVRHIKCAFIDLEKNHEFVSLYLNLMKHRGYRIQFFDNPDAGKDWLQTGLEIARTTHEQSAPFTSGRLFGKILDACVRVSGRV